MLKFPLLVALACTMAASADSSLNVPLLLAPVTDENVEAKPPKKTEKTEAPKKDEKKKDKVEKAKKPQEKAKKPSGDIPAKKKSPSRPDRKDGAAESGNDLPDQKALGAAKEEQAALAVLNSLAEEKQKQQTAELRMKIEELKLQKEFLTEKLALAAAKERAELADTLAEYEAEKEKLTREATLAKLEADRLANELKALQTESTIKTATLMAEVSEFEAAEKRDDYASAKPQYLDDPLKKDGTLVVSDRRIPFNGPVTSTLADRVTTRINYFNNKDPKKPIFLVIDDSPGGSVMAGYRILKAMEGSEAPVYVVVKSFAASMAATITTLAERSFVYPNAIILHHQISQSFMFSSMNLTEQKENLEDLKRWWARLADPIAQKMGITADEFIEMMYEKTVSGDWTEFGDDAVKLKWADHVVNRVHETALLKNPDAKASTATSTTQSAAIENGLTPAVDDEGNPYMILPRRNPKDVYLMHNPDGFYRFK